MSTYDFLDEVPWSTVKAVTSPNGNIVGLVDGFAVWKTGPQKGHRIPLDAGGPWTPFPGKVEVLPEAWKPNAVGDVFMLVMPDGNKRMMRVTEIASDDSWKATSADLDEATRTYAPLEVRMTGQAEQSDFAGLVAMATVAALDGCPWVEKGHLWELSSAVAELVVARVREVDSLLLPDGTLLEKQGGDPGPDCWQLVVEKQDLREALAGLRDAGRQAYRQIGLFLEDGQRNRLIVAQAILDPEAEREPRCSEYCGDVRHPEGCEPVGPDDEYRGQ